MSIAFACEGCGKRYEVDASKAGRRGRCPTCGREFTVPPATVPAPIAPRPALAPTGYDPAGDAYDLDDGPSSFTPAQGDEQAAPSSWERPRADDLPRPKRSKRVERGQFVRWRNSLIALAVALVAVVVLSLLFPSMATAVGTVATIAGLLLALGGYAMAVYVAFTEDFVHGFFCLVFAPYAAWYCVSRFDDLKAPLAATALGLTLAMAGGWALEYGQGGAGAPQNDAGAAAGDVDE